MYLNFLYLKFYFVIIIHLTILGAAEEIGSVISIKGKTYILNETKTQKRRCYFSDLIKSGEYIVCIDGFVLVKLNNGKVLRLSKQAGASVSEDYTLVFQSGQVELIDQSNEEALLLLARNDQGLEILTTDLDSKGLK